MNPFREEANNLIHALANTQSVDVQYDLIVKSPITWLYEKTTKQSISNLSKQQAVLVVWNFAQKLVTEKEPEKYSNVPDNLKELIEQHEKAKKQDWPSGFERQLQKKIIDAWVKYQKQKRLIGLLVQKGMDAQPAERLAPQIANILDNDKKDEARAEVLKILQTHNTPNPQELTEEIRTVHNNPLVETHIHPFLRKDVPQKTPDARRENKKEEQKEAQRLLIKVFYSSSSSPSEILHEIEKASLEFPPGQESLKLLLTYGIGPTLFKNALDKFYEDNPSLRINNPLIIGLEKQLNELTKLSTSHTDLFRGFEKQIVKNELSLVNPNQSLPSETETEKILLAYSQNNGSSFSLKVQGYPQDLKTSGNTGTISPLIQKAAKKGVKSLGGKAYDALFSLRKYLGLSFIASSFILPLPLPAKAGLFLLGVWLSRYKLKKFLSEAIPYIRKPEQGRTSKETVLKTSRNIAWALLNKNTLQGVRLTIAGGLGLGALFLPIPIPFKIFLGSAGLGLSIKDSIKTLSSLIRLTGSVGRMFGIIGVISFPVWILIATFLVVLGIIFIGGYYAATSTQGVFLTSGQVKQSETESQYIGISVSSDFSALKNEDLPKNITLSIKITAKEGNLSALSVKESFSVFKENGSPSIPTQILSPPQETIQQGESIELSASIPADQSFENSIITTNTVVEADVNLTSETRRETANKNFSIIIGNPPTSCFAFTDDGGPWTESDKSFILNAIAHISRSPAFVAKVCSNGTVNLIRRYTDPRYSGEVIGGHNVYFYDRAFSSTQQALYTFSHEIGHVYGNRNSGDLSAFRKVYKSDPVPSEYFPTYPVWIAAKLTQEKRISEDFAETIAIYAIWKVVPTLGVYSLSQEIQKRPDHYNFAKNVLFNGVEF